MGIFSFLCSSSDDFDICEERGHDYRERVEVEKTCKVVEHRIKVHREQCDVDERVKTFDIRSSEMYYPMFLYERVTSVCRDCGNEVIKKETDGRLALCEDGEFRPVSDLFEAKENSEEDNNE